MNDLLKLMGQRIRDRRVSLKMSQTDLAKRAGYSSRSSINKVEKGIVDIPQSKIKLIADVLMTTPACLMGWEEPDQNTELLNVKPNAVFLPEKNIHLIPLFENVSAGFGALAINSVVDYVPLYFGSDAEAQESICIKVQGDSMYPKIEDGDIIQVHKQESVDSGALAVVLLDNEEGLVKKVVYGEDWIELHSINPMYKTMRFEKKDVLRIRVLGAVKKIIKNV
ncbi:MAG: helix-turn-helix transcriptional regulator [Clostridia bacterium]|nr:helix-turn-helix transcriptional regulator [Clostridia bacterium]